MVEQLEPGKDQPQGTPQSSNPAGIRPECRICMSYYYDRDVDVFTFQCDKGWFDFQETPEGPIGRTPEKGSINGDLPCEGAGFHLNVQSPWFKYIYPEKT
jgi:hypothetical protein